YYPDCFSLRAVSGTPIDDDALARAVVLLRGTERVVLLRGTERVVLLRGTERVVRMVWRRYNAGVAVNRVGVGALFNIWQHRFSGGSAAFAGRRIEDEVAVVWYQAFGRLAIKGHYRSPRVGVRPGKAQADRLADLRGSHAVDLRHMMGRHAAAAGSIGT